MKLVLVVLVVDEVGTILVSVVLKLLKVVLAALVVDGVGLHWVDPRRRGAISQRSATAPGATATDGPRTASAFIVFPCKSIWMLIFHLGPELKKIHQQITQSQLLSRGLIEAVKILPWRSIWWRAGAKSWAVYKIHVIWITVKLAPDNHDENRQSFHLNALGSLQPFGNLDPSARRARVRVTLM